MDLSGWAVRAKASVERVPMLRRLLRDFVRIEFVDRCMLIAAQGLLALIPMLVVLAAFLPQLTSAGMENLATTTGLGHTGNREVTAELDVSTVRAQTGFVGLAITVLSATSFSRAIQRMYERVWEQAHVGGFAGVQRSLLWLIGWVLALQVISLLRMLPDSRWGVVLDVARVLLQVALIGASWWVTSKVLLFGRVGWLPLLPGAVLNGVLQVAYSRGAGLVMPAYVRDNAEQFGALGVVLSLATWLIGFAGVVVASTLVGRVMAEDPSFRALAGGLWGLVGPRRGRPTRLD